ncbi:MAG TPA: glutamine synthetase family protein [Paracoccaceae bacterium]|nr:glutamine synthetase family protein [Paracoccaceae bacterium]
MAGKLSFDDLKGLVQAGEIDTVLVAQIDMQGRLMGKRFHADFFVQSAWKETHSCNYLMTVDMEMTPVPGYSSASWERGYGDYAMKPDMDTLRIVPWLPKTALVLCDLEDHATHAPVPMSPRAMLRRQIARLDELGYRPMMASELEFYLFRTSFEEAAAQGYTGLAPISAYNEDYHIFQTTKEEDVMRAIRNGLAGANIPVENTKGEADAGQAEVNVTYADALTMADNHVIIKNAVKEIAWGRGRAVTFMAKWSSEHAGSSSHVHQSLIGHDGKPAFRDPDAEHTMSPVMRHYVAGLLAHASDITYFLAPYVNSYKRFMTGTFAPTKAVWSVDNRTSGYRVVGVGTKGVRVECRVGGADLNPYLAFAAQLAAGIAGIEQKLELEPMFSGDAYAGEGREIPKTLRDAVAALDGSAMLRRAFGDDVVDHYVHAGSWEQAECDRSVTDWDLKRGFERA